MREARATSRRRPLVLGVSQTPCLPSMGSPKEPQEETMRAIRPTRVTMIPLAGLALLVSACSGMLGPEDSKTGLSCIDDSPECVERRQAALSSMLADKDRTWVKEPPPPKAHASGVRLFAFRSAKTALTCEELAQQHRRAFLLVWRLDFECPLARERQSRALFRVVAVAQRRRSQHGFPQRLLTNANLHLIRNTPDLMELPLHPRRVDPTTDWLHTSMLVSVGRVTRVRPRRRAR